MNADVLSGGSFVNTIFDGVMGLATAGELDGGHPFFRSLRDAGKLTLPWISIYYSNNDAKPGQIIFGGVDNALMLPQSSMTWHPPGSMYPTYWTVNIERIEVGSEVVYSCEEGSSCSLTSAPREAMVDSGTSLIMIPDNVGSLDVKSFTASGDCGNVNSLPEITFFMRSVDGTLMPYSLTGSDYTINRAGSCLTGNCINPCHMRTKLE